MVFYEPTRLNRQAVSAAERHFMREVITVNSNFLKHREEKFNQYNQRGRTDRKFLMDLDAELLEHTMIEKGRWFPHPSWMVDFMDKEGKSYDVKFIRGYWNVSREKTLNVIKQRNILNYFIFFEWDSKPNRPLQDGDEVTVQLVKTLTYDEVADNLRKSYKEPDGFYVDVRKL